jgi:serpin B
MHFPERRRFLKTCAALGAGAVPWGCSLFPIDQARKVIPPPDPHIVDSINAFSIDLYRQLAAKPGNLFVSPFSIESALAMTAAGAKGTTHGEMQSVLHLPGMTAHASYGFRQLSKQLTNSSDVELNIANGIWADKSVKWKKDYLLKLEEYHGGGFVDTDFSKPEKARDEVNQWVSKQTKQKIKEILSTGSIGKDTRMILANAIYFHGKWANKFPEKETKDGPFRGNANASPSNAKFMQQTATFNYLRERDYQAIDLPYLGDKFSMTIILPNEKVGLPALEKLLTNKAFQSICNEMGNKHTAEVDVKLPKFKQESSYDLITVLKEMGIREAFGPSAHFSAMHSGTDPLYISLVQHKAFIDVAEEGTEAAAATAVAMATFGAAPSMAPEIPKFYADHPFLYAIRHRPSGAILFMGRVETV